MMVPIDTVQWCTFYLGIDSVNGFLQLPSHVCLVLTVWKLRLGNSTTDTDSRSDVVAFTKSHWRPGTPFVFEKLMVVTFAWSRSLFFVSKSVKFAFTAIVIRVDRAKRSFLPHCRALSNSAQPVIVGELTFRSTYYFSSTGHPTVYKHSMLSN